MKTLKEWMKTDGSFREYVKPGDEVDEAMVDYFMNILPPRKMSYGYLQVGEPIKSCQDKDGRWKETYATFEKIEGKWVYQGCCFPGRSEDMSNRKGDPWEEGKKD